MKSILFLLLCCALPAAAGPTPKYNPPGTTNICPAGMAMTYVMQCDPGSRSKFDSVWNQRTPGSSVCRIKPGMCAEIEFRAEDERPGYEVRDAVPGNELVFVIFGVERLLGEGRWERP